MIGDMIIDVFLFFFFKQKTAYEMRISDWSSDVCSSDLLWLLVRAERRYLDAAAASTVSGAGRDEAIAHGSCRQGAEGGPVRRCASGRRRFEHPRLADHRIPPPIHVGGDPVEQRERPC